jgi:hypothetical protein
MPGNLLQPEQRQCLEALRRDGQEDTLRRRAQILLSYDDGQPTADHQVSAQAPAISAIPALYEATRLPYTPQSGVFP